MGAYGELWPLESPIGQCARAGADVELATHRFSPPGCWIHALLDSRNFMRLFVASMGTGHDPHGELWSLGPWCIGGGQWHECCGLGPGHAWRAGLGSTDSRRQQRSARRFADAYRTQVFPSSASLRPAPDLAVAHTSLARAMGNLGLRIAVRLPGLRGAATSREPATAHAWWLTANKAQRRVPMIIKIHRCPPLPENAVKR